MKPYALAFQKEFDAISAKQGGRGVRLSLLSSLESSTNTS